MKKGIYCQKKVDTVRLYVFRKTFMLESGKVDKKYKYT